MRSEAFAVVLALVTTAANAQSALHARIADAALGQVGVTTSYDSSYVRLTYPGGDVAHDRGVCSDVVVRAFRGAGIDLQRLVHEDMAAHFSLYPRMWGLSAPDANIDHRRVPNLMTYFIRHGKGRPPGDRYEPGDVVAWRLPSGLYHVGVVSDVRGASDYLVVHNIGYGARNEDVLRAFTIIGHYRW